MKHRFLALLLITPCLHAAEPNALTPEEQRQGYQLLFDGQSLQGWQLLRPDAAAQGNWAVEEGCLVPKGRPRELMTTAEYGDFELLFDWKIGKAGNSGVLYRIEPQYNAPTSGPEYQLLDDANHPAATQYPDRRTGAAYAIYPPTDRASSTTTRRPAGQWNTSRILVRGNHVEHWLNGVQVLAYELHSPDWKERVSKSKFAKQPQYGRAAKGRIVLQDHNSAVWFRNLKVRSF